jgi:ParB/RepB/Spo0J family partition protein
MLSNYVDPPPEDDSNNTPTISENAAHKENPPVPIPPSPARNIIQVSIDSVEPDPNQPRKLFPANTLWQLKNSIQSTGFIEPLIVRENKEKPGRYFIVDGERRWRSCKALGHATMTCCVISPASNDYEILAFTQNVHRDDLSTMEKAVALDKIFNREKAGRPDFQQKDLVPVVNLSESYISELLKISKLDEDIKEEALRSTKWTRFKLLQIARLKGAWERSEKFQEYRGRINKKHLGDQENPSENDDGEAIPTLEPDMPPDAGFDKKFLRIKGHVDAIKAKLEKIENARPNALDLEALRPDLNEIVGQILKLIG